MHLRDAGHDDYNVRRLVASNEMLIILVTDYPTWDCAQYIDPHNIQLLMSLLCLKRNLQCHENWLRLLKRNTASRQRPFYKIDISYAVFPPSQKINVRCRSFERHYGLESGQH